MSESENPFQHVGLRFIETRLQELADNLPYEVDLDTSELLFLQQAIVLCEAEMTAERAFELKKILTKLSELSKIREALQSLLHGVSISKSGKGQYGQHKSKARSRFVHRKA